MGNNIALSIYISDCGRTFSNCGRTFVFSRRGSPELCFTLHPLSKRRAQGRPGAGRHPRSTVLNVCTRNAQRHTGEAGNNPAFPARWVYGLCRALLGDEFVLVTVASRIDDASNTGWVDASPQVLDRSNDGQDHTVLPYAGFSPSPRLRRDKPPAKTKTKISIVRHAP